MFVLWRGLTLTQLTSLPKNNLCGVEMGETINRSIIFPGWVGVNKVRHI